MRQNQSSNLQNQARPGARSLPSNPSESYGIRGLVNHNFEPPCQDSEFPTIEVLSQTGQELEVLSYLGKYLPFTACSQYFFQWKSKYNSRFIFTKNCAK